MTDEGGLSSGSDQVAVSSSNLAPRAVAKSDFGIYTVGDTANLDAFESNDPENDALTYQWFLDFQPTNSSTSLSDSTVPNPTLFLDAEGTYTLTLLVSDFLGYDLELKDELTFIATTAEEYAEIQIILADDIVDSLDAGQVTNQGNQNAFGNFLQHAITNIQLGNLADAIDDLNNALQRTDGCVLNGTPDINGNGKRDWITDCDIQEALHALLTDAIQSLLE